jgi:membrane dipeptidase
MLDDVKVRAEALHRESLIIDGLEISRWGDEAVYRHLREGGLTAINASVAVWEGAKETMANIGRLYRDFRRFAPLIRQITRVADFAACKREGRTGIVIGFQNSSPLEGDLDLLEVFYNLGVRVIQITYNDLNFVGAGCYERQDIGLSDFGLEVVREMNRLGMVIDLSHVGYRTTMEAIEASSAPVWFSHANPMALKKHVRNKTDEQVKALVAKGGLVGANAFPPFLAREYESTIEDFLDVIEHWVGVAGVDHVSLGLDFTEGHTNEWFDWLMRGKRKDKMVWPLKLPLKNPDGIDGAREFPNITEGLLRRGHSEVATRKIMGGNIVRLFERVWQE